MVRFKEVKNYSGRKRINIVKDDNFKTGETVVVLSKTDYETLIQENKDLKHELEKDNNIDTILETTIKAVTSNHDKQMQKLENKLNEKDNEINKMKGMFTRFITGFSSLSLFDLIFKQKQKELIKDFESSIYIEVAEVKQIDRKK